LHICEIFISKNKTVNENKMLKLTPRGKQKIHQEAANEQNRDITDWQQAEAARSRGT
jgi:DNA polymerase III delta prime subunit